MKLSNAILLMALLLATQFGACLCYGQMPRLGDQSEMSLRDSRESSASSRSDQTLQSQKELVRESDGKDMSLRSANGKALRVLIDFRKLELNPGNSRPPKIEEIKKALGPGSGGGGGTCALMLLTHTQVLMNYLGLGTGDFLKLNSEQHEDLLRAIRSAIFVKEPNLTHDGVSVDFINYNENDNHPLYLPNTIAVDEKFCEKTNTLSSKVVATLLHEFLRLAKIEDRAPAYPVSAPFLIRLSNSMGETHLTGKTYICRDPKFDNQLGAYRRFEITFRGAQVSGRVVHIYSNQSEYVAEHFTTEGDNANVTGVNTLGAEKTVNIQFSKWRDESNANLVFDDKQGHVRMWGSIDCLGDFEYKANLICSLKN